MRSLISKTFSEKMLIGQTFSRFIQPSFYKTHWSIYGFYFLALKWAKSKCTPLCLAHIQFLLPLRYGCKTKLFSVSSFFFYSVCYTITLWSFMLFVCELCLIHSYWLKYYLVVSRTGYHHHSVDLWYISSASEASSSKEKGWVKLWLGLA